MWFEFDAVDSLVLCWATVMGEPMIVDEMTITEYQTVFGLQAARQLLAGR